MLGKSSVSDPSAMLSFSKTRQPNHQPNFVIIVLNLFVLVMLSHHTAFGLLIRNCEQ